MPGLTVGPPLGPLLIAPFGHACGVDLAPACQLLAGQLAVFLAQLARRFAVQAETLGRLHQCLQIGIAAGVAPQKGRQLATREHAWRGSLDVLLDAQLERLDLPTEQGRKAGAQLGRAIRLGGPRRLGRRGVAAGRSYHGACCINTCLSTGFDTGFGTGFGTCISTSISTWIGGGGGTQWQDGHGRSIRRRVGGHGGERRRGFGQRFVGKHRSHGRSQDGAKRALCPCTADLGMAADAARCCSAGPPQNRAFAPPCDPALLGPCLAMTPTSVASRADCAALDAADPLAPLRELFHLPAGQIYLDGNSLGVLPRATPAALARVAEQEWGRDLIQSWNKAGWIDAPLRVGDKIGRLIGARPGETLAADSTSINLYKVLAVAMSLAGADTPARRVIVSERDNFPTDLYIAQSLAHQHGWTLQRVGLDELPAAIAAGPGLVLLTQVNYRSGRRHDMAAVNRAAHAAGSLVVWDLAHSAGAVPVDLHGGDSAAETAADFAVGCGYKYLNGGPGAPAFVWLHPRHAARLDSEAVWQPLAGWLGHAAPFEFTPDYRPAAGVARFVCGTPSPLALAALECGVDTLLAAEPLGGMAALRAKSLALSDLFMQRVASRCAGHGLRLCTPKPPAERGSQVSLARHDGGYAIVQALIARGVVGDFRAPDILRFGFTPAYLRHVDVWDAVEQLAEVLESGEWRAAQFHQRAAVT
ncbi:MAG: hypothetical protein RIQ60_3287 [Pseudomonadota bacterium]|jgi:kynureninase